MRADRVLVEHHAVLRGLLAGLLDTGPSDARSRVSLADELAMELEVHTAIEDELFYPAARAVSPLLGIAHAEHRVIADQLAALLRRDPAGAAYAAEVRALRDALEQHAGKEERELFPQSMALGEERLERLGEQLRARQEQLRASPVSQWRLRAKRELLKRL